MSDEHSAEKTKNSRRRNGYAGTIALFVLACALTLIRILLAENTPLTPNMTEKYDDSLLMGYAESIARGEWLGTYQFTTLAKRPGYSLILVLISMVGISYQLFFIGLQVVGSIVFTLAVRPIVPSKSIRLILYVALLYLPALFTWELFQRVYRMGIVIPFVMLIAACYIGVYLRRDDSSVKLLPWVMILAFCLPCFYLIKEDSIWIAPFVIAVSLLMLGHWIRCAFNRQASVWNIIKKIFLTSVPIACVALVIIVVGNINYQYYNERTICERSDSSFTKAMSALVSIDDQKSNRVVWVTRNALEQALNCSPTLRSIKSEIDEKWDEWGSVEGEVIGDHSYWALLAAYSESGRCVSGSQSESFWKNVSDELLNGFESGELSKKTGVKISSSVQPIQQQDVEWLMRATLRNVWMLFSLERANVSRNPGNGEIEEQLAVQSFLHAPCIVEGDEGEAISRYGWALSVDEWWLKACKAVSKPMTYLMLLPLSFVLYCAFCRKHASAKIALLIVIGLGLTALELVCAVTWFTAFLGDIAEWAAYMYCASFYPLLAMAEAIVVGASLQLILDHYQSSSVR